MNLKKEKNSMYFGKEVEIAIGEFVRCEDSSVKERIFSETIYPALNKLAENVIRNKKFYNFGINGYLDCKHECVVHMAERLNKFKPDRGNKAFSYFNRVAINWVWANMRKVGEDTYGKCEVEEIDKFRDLSVEQFNSDYKDELRDFCEKWAVWGMAHLDYFFFLKNGKVQSFSKKDKQIANAIFNLFANSNSIDIYNKKALYILIREQVEVKTQSITDVVNVFKPLCKEMYMSYKDHGTKYWHRFLYFPEEIETEDNYIQEIFNDLS